MIEQQQLHLVGVGAVQRKVDADPVPRRPPRIRRARSDRVAVLVVRLPPPGRRPVIIGRRVAARMTIAGRVPRARGRIRTRSRRRNGSGRCAMIRSAMIRRATGVTRTRIHSRGVHWRGTQCCRCAAASSVVLLHQVEMSLLLWANTTKSLPDSRPTGEIHATPSQLAALHPPEYRN